MHLFSTSSHLSKLRPSDGGSLIDCNDRCKDNHQKPDVLMEHHAPVHQTATIRYVTVVDYRMYRLNGCSSCYDDSVSRYKSKIFIKLRSQMRTHGFGLAELISVFGFLTTSKLACDANCIHEGAEMPAMPAFVADCVASFCNCRMARSDGTQVITTTVNFN